jgi:hypothetical protein
MIRTGWTAIEPIEIKLWQPPLVLCISKRISTLYWGMDLGLVATPFHSLI